MTAPGNVRHWFCLNKSLSDRLKALTKDPGVTMSAIVSEALAAWFNRKGEDEIEHRFAKRLDSFSAQLARMERNEHISIECLALFVRYMLMVTPPLSENDDAGRALGSDRFNAFIQRVAQQLANGHVTFAPDKTP